VVVRWLLRYFCEMEKDTKRVFLLLGSNQGDKRGHIQRAVDQIGRRAGRLIRRSSLYQTEAWGKEDQDDFINQAIEIETGLSPQELLVLLLDIEKEIGRIRREKWEARVIDIDILFYGNKQVNEPDLQIPHPHFQERNFAILPMMELAPDFVHPKSQLTIEEIYTRSKDPLDVILLDS
jgi:2-amino-4-hydroxy-6-hydroxymethyldihydropteridine diphosphokinase